MPQVTETTTFTLELLCPGTFPVSLVSLSLYTPTFRVSSVSCYTAPSPLIDIQRTHAPGHGDHYIHVIVAVPRYFTCLISFTFTLYRYSTCPITFTFTLYCPSPLTDVQRTHAAGHGDHYIHVRVGVPRYSPSH